MASNSKQQGPARGDRRRRRDGVAPASETEHAPGRDTQQLQQSLGNAGFLKLISSGSALSHAAVQVARREAGATAVLQREDGPAAPAPAAEEELKEAPAPEQLPKETMDQAKSVQVLTDAFGSYVKKIKGGKLKMLDQAAFEAAYDKIYRGTKFAWARYIVPNEGNLQGFAYKGVNYINTDIANLDTTIPHEMLHNNASSTWKSFAGSELNEGTTEYLTQKALNAAGYNTKPDAYIEQTGVANQLAQAVGEDVLINAFFHGRTKPLKKAMEENCAGTWKQFRKAMQAQDWATASYYLDIVPAEPTPEQLEEWGAK